MSERMRVAAVIQQGTQVLMVRERVQTAPGHHDGPEYWTLPRLGDDNLDCPCPRMVALDWVVPPSLTTRHGGSPVPLLIYAW